MDCHQKLSAVWALLIVEGLQCPIVVDFCVIKSLVELYSITMNLETFRFADAVLIIVI